MKLIRISAIWCPACLIMRSKVDEMKERFPNIEHIEYDYDMDEDIVNQFDVGNKLPVFILLDNGKEINRLVGEKTTIELEQFLKGSNI